MTDSDIIDISNIKNSFTTNSKEKIVLQQIAKKEELSCCSKVTMTEF